ncbi:MAG TPA: NlpC/P60 family protein, partial [Planctomycetes bacterium]|nr:NlpC/P60 family protein [Planctomycetota bacterium]
RLLLQAWQKGKALDPTQGWLQVEVKREGPRWALLGSSEFPGLARAAGALLEAAGFRPLENRVRLLPDGAAGNPPYGVFRAARALTWARPGEASGLSAADGPGQVEETELLFGDPLRVLDKQKGFLLVHAASGYLGWVEEKAVLRCSEKRFLSLLAAPRALFLKSYRRGDVEVPAGAALPFRGKKGDLVLLETPRGGILPVPSRWVKLSDPSRGEAAAALALSALGTPYLFGGRDREEGIDCSGLVQACWAAQGVRLPRDARMQVLCGRLVGWKGKWEALRPGDVLFFMNRWGRISHVALSLGGSRFVHATPPEVTVGSLDPADPWYTSTARRFVLAKRIRL